MGEVTPDSAETRRLLQQVRAGEREAFDQLFDRHRAFLSGVVERRLDPKLGARLDPSDVVQETQMAAFRRLPDYLHRRPMPFRLWLQKTALERLLNLRRNHVEAARRTVDREISLSDRSSMELAQCLAASGTSPSEGFAKRQRARRMREALATLSQTDREILLMRYVENLSNQEVAYLLEIAPDAASKRHGRALLRLQKALSQMRSSES